jgi:hypothetical protein
MLVAVGWPSFMVNNGCGCNMDGQGMKRTRVVARTSSLQSLKDSAAGWILLAEEVDQVCVQPLVRAAVAELSGRDIVN